jgi:ribonuclease-3
MSKIRATVASELILSEVALSIGLNNFLFLGTGEDKHGGRKKHSILADAFESLLASIYLSLGYEFTQNFIIKNLNEHIEKAVAGELFLDYKTKLQEITQDVFKVLPDYEIIKAKGPSHIRYYKIGVKVDGKIYGIGEGHSKKIAEQIAAREACKKIRKE